MTAFLFLGIAFVFTIVNRLYAKKTLNTLDTYSVTFLSNVFCVLVLLPYGLYKFSDILALSGNQLLIIFILGVLWATIAWVINASVALNDFSFKEIIRQTRVVLVVMGGVVFLGEALTFFDVIGIGAIILSTVIVSWRKVTLRDHLTSKPILLAWLSSVLVAVATLLEKHILMEVDVLLYAFLGAFAIPTILLSLFLTKKRRATVNEILNHHKIEIILFSTFMLTAFVAGLFVYKLLPISIAYPLIQSATVFSVLIGTAIFEDNQQWKRKSIAAVIAVVGVILIQMG